VYLQINRVLDHGEMKEALLDLGLFKTEQNLEVLFRQLDKDTSGTLDFEASTLTNILVVTF
jgi:Ca2+-binding EF-hand superfamily protein